MMSDALLSRSPSREQGCWGCSRTRCRDIDVTVFGISRGNNGNVSGESSYLVSSGGAHCFTVLLHLLFSTSSEWRNIHRLYHFCVLHLEYLEYTLWTYPDTAQDQGYRRHKGLTSWGPPDRDCSNQCCCLRSVLPNHRHPAHPVSVLIPYPLNRDTSSVVTKLYDTEILQYYTTSYQAVPVTVSILLVFTQWMYPLYYTDVWLLWVEPPVLVI